MTTIAEMYNNFKRVNLRKQVPIILEQNKEELIALNQRQLYIKSQDSEEEPLQFYRSNGYADLKHRLNSSPGFGRPDLFLTGAFYKGFTVTVSPTFYIINSNDSKTQKLVAKYGPNIFGLSEESKAQFIEERLRKGIANHIYATTGLILQ